MKIAILSKSPLIKAPRDLPVVDWYWRTGVASSLRAQWFASKQVVATQAEVSPQALRTG